MTDNLKLSTLQIDALREINSIGAGNAATGLSKLLNRKINITMPRTEILPLEKVPEFIGPLDTLVSAVYIRLINDISGAFLLIFSESEAMKLTKILTGAEDAPEEIRYSALKETANIVLGCYMSAVSKMIGAQVVYGPPEIANDMLGAVIDGILIEIGMEAEDTAVVETEFFIENIAIKGHLLLLPEPRGLKFILEKLGVKS